MSVDESIQPRQASFTGAAFTGVNSGDAFGLGWDATNLDFTDYIRIDASSYSGISFYAQGFNNEILSLGVHTANTRPDSSGGECTNECWKGYFADVQLTNEWKKYFVPFCIFEQETPVSAMDITTIMSVQFLARFSGTYSVLIDDVSFE